MIKRVAVVAAARHAFPASLVALAAAVGAPAFSVAADPAAATHHRTSAVAGRYADSQLVPAALPPWARSSRAVSPAAAPQQQGTSPAPGKEAAPIASATPGTPAPTPPLAAGVSAAPARSATDDEALLQSPLTVVRWGFNAAARRDGSGALVVVASAGRPLQLWLTIEGGQTAIEELQAAGRLTIAVHWQRADKSPGPGVPDLTTELTIGRPGLAAILARQVQRQGYFQWHLWSRKDALSPGQWIVSLSYPDGAPVRCGQVAPQPCRLSVSAG